MFSRKNSIAEVLKLRRESTNSDASNVEMPIQLKINALSMDCIRFAESMQFRDLSRVKTQIAENFNIYSIIDDFRDTQERRYMF